MRFVGNADPAELTALYNACDIFVLPSVTRAEAFGMVQIEAMSCRKPVICTDLPSGVPWVNQHGITGLVVPPQDPTALCGALSTLVADPLLRARMGDLGRARVESEFSIRRLVQQTTGLYSRWSIGRRRRPPTWRPQILSIVQLACDMPIPMEDALPFSQPGAQPVNTAVLDAQTPRAALPPVAVPFGKRTLDVCLSGVGLLAVVADLAGAGGRHQARRRRAGVLHAGPRRRRRQRLHRLQVPLDDPRRRGRGRRAAGDRATTRASRGSVG